MKPWTQTIQIQWRPELRFYEVRIAILRMLEDREILKAFRVGEDFVDAQLFDARTQFSVHQSGLSLSLSHPEANLGLAWEAITIAIAQVRPAEARRVLCAFQHIAELPSSFDEAVRAGAKGVLQSRVSSAEASDWAVLLDVQVAGEPSLQGQVEYGIVRARELADRLARRVGRMRESPVLDRQLWTNVQFPQVALFADTRLEAQTDAAADDLAATARTVLGKCEADANALVEDLILRLDLKQDNVVGEGT